MADIQNLAILAGVRITLFDIIANKWAEFLPSVKSHRKHIILTAHNKHATNYSHTPTYSLISTNPNKDKKIIQFVDNIDITQYPDAIQLSYKRDSRVISFLTTQTHIIKTKFDECEEYQDQFTDGGVGKSKFLQQHPQFAYSSSPPYELSASSTSGFMCRTALSSSANIKYDQNQAYKSFEYSGCFRGFPESLSQLYKFAPNTHFSDVPSLHGRHGLMYVEFPTITVESLNACVPVYFNGSNYYPIEIIESLFLIEKIDPVIKEVVLSDSSFNVDFTGFTKNQFRSFIGKTTASTSTNRLITFSYNEFIHLRYTLGDDVLTFDDKPAPGHPYQIEYERSDYKVWSCFQIGSYVKAHQKLVLFRQINKLLAVGIVPTYISTDGIEIDKTSIKLTNTLFDVGTNLGQWKIEAVNTNTSPDFRVSDHSVPFVGNVDIPLFKSDIKPLPQLLHICGAAGNGKTQLALQLGTTYGLNNIVYLTPENDLITTLKDKAKTLVGEPIEVYTYHTYFGVNCQSKVNVNHRTFVFEEASKMSPEHFILIEQQLRMSFNAKKPFGGVRVVLVGDFKQLPPVIIDNNYLTDEDGTQYMTIETLPIYTQNFKLMEKKTNYRQNRDKDFYAMCNQLRNRHTLTEDETKELLDTLNTRVKPPAVIAALDLTGENSVYIAGKNAVVDTVNRSAPAECKKVVNLRKHASHIGTVQNGSHGFVVGKVRSDDDTTDVYKINFNGVEHHYHGTYPKDAIARAYCLTIHRVQGRTYDTVVIDPASLFCKNHLYVAVTRCTEFKNLYLSSKVTPYMLKHC
jgi:hypothetical protein